MLTKSMEKALAYRLKPLGYVKAVTVDEKYQLIHVQWKKANRIKIVSTFDTVEGVETFFKLKKTHGPTKKKSPGRQRLAYYLRRFFEWLGY